MFDDFDYRKDEVRRKYLPDIDGRMTFAGAFLEYFYILPSEKSDSFQEDGEYELQYSSNRKSIFSRSISEETLKRYINEIIDRVIPNVDPNSMTMDEYNLDYFENALQTIKRRFELHDDSSYRLNIRRIYNAWANDQDMLIDRIIWPEDESRINTKDSIEKRKRRLTKPRSLGIPGEIEIFKWIYSFDNDSISDADLGIILMFFLGLRNNEAAGRTFGDIKEIQGTGHHCIYVLTSTKGRTSELKVGGKTSNAFRVIPLYDFLYDYLMERRAYLIRKWKEADPSLTNEAIARKISVQRIASDVFSNTGVSSPDLTKRGKEVLTEILRKCSNKDISYSDAEYDFRYKLQTIGIEDEDSPTTYLFRRNFATHAVNIGLTPPQVEFLIGHEIEEQGMHRHFFNTGEELAEIAETMQFHPFCLLDRIIRGKEDAKDYQEIKIELKNIRSDNAGYIRMITNEPLDDIIIEINGEPTKVLVSKSRFELSHGYSTAMNIKEKMLQVYKKKAKEYLDGSKKP